jgi:hypothetical protein
MNLKQAVITYIKSLSEQERQALTTMVKNGIKCCVGYAETKGINPDLFNSELKAVLLEDD